MNFHGLWTLVILSFSILAFGQDFDEETSNLEEIENVTSKSKISYPENTRDISKKLTLKDVIEEGLRKNNMQRSREYEKEENELQWLDNHADFWFPQLSLQLSSGETLVDNLYTDLNSNNGTGKTPNGFIGLGFDNYTVFNWGKDFLDYQNNKNSYNRKKQYFQEQRRLLRFNLIAQYFNLARAKRILQIKKNQLRHTSFIYRLAKEKLTLKKINGQHYLQAKAEFLRSHSEFQQANSEVIEQENKMANYLGDELTTSYSPVEQLKFVPMTTNKDESYKFALSTSPEFLEAKKDLENANRSFQKTLKENMPLPKFDLKLGAFKHHFTSAGSYDQMGIDNGSRNVELVASLNMSWKIFGSGGLFNNRIAERSYLQKRIAEIKFTEAKRDTSTKVNTYHRKIRYLEKQVEANSAFVKNAQKTFDRTLDNYISGKTSFINVKMVLDSLILSEVQLENSKYQHMETKLQLSHIMGMDDFPGESFEKMVMQ